jgi:ABC-type phosphate/phosphonate transport system substrate-binding protein
MKKRILLVVIAIAVATLVSSCRPCKAHSGKWDTHRRR